MLIRDIVSATPVMPVIVIERAADAVPLARALLAGGIRVLEVTLRTAAALDGIRAIAREVPQALVGAGTVLSPADFEAARQAGARFAVSPGATPELLAAAGRDGLPFLPGVMTPSDLVAAVTAGYQVLKFFPAVPAGGVAMLNALAGPFPQVQFCPTGGISLDSAPQFLALPNVCCVGGSWITPAALIQSKDWSSITRLAQQARSLRA
jgi:2-dehydro-3-deoxyphosphogluconate aldolase / (4S)-4-hydroxy-2-oxoglutarate aldolase